MWKDTRRVTKSDPPPPAGLFGRGGLRRNAIIISVALALIAVIAWIWTRA